MSSSKVLSDGMYVTRVTSSGLVSLDPSAAHTHTKHTHTKHIHRENEKGDGSM